MTRGAAWVAAASLASVVAGCAGSVPTTLGPSEAGLAPCPASPNCVSTASGDERHAVDAFVLARPVPEVWEAVELAVASLPGSVVVTSATGYLHAECTSSLMRYVDDLEVWAPPDARQLQVRSASRVGYSDMGVNRKRVEELRRQLDTAGVLD